MVMFMNILNPWRNIYLNVQAFYLKNLPTKFSFWFSSFYFMFRIFPNYVVVLCCVYLRERCKMNLKISKISRNINWEKFYNLVSENFCASSSKFSWENVAHVICILFDCKIIVSIFWKRFHLFISMITH